MPKVEALNMDASFLSRNVNEGFSGGEKKRNEILQLAVLEADVAILDEIDSGPSWGQCAYSAMYWLCCASFMEC